MKLNKFAYLYSKPLGNHTLKIMKKIPGNLLKNLEKSWKYHGILSVRKSGNPEGNSTYNIIECILFLPNSAFRFQDVLLIYFCNISEKFSEEDCLWIFKLQKVLGCTR